MTRQFLRLQRVSLPASATYLGSVLGQVLLLMALLSTPLPAQPAPDLIVAADGSGDVLTIQAALDLIPEDNAERIRIFIKPGTYVEKLFIQRNCVSLEGSDPMTTIIHFPILRRTWRQTHTDDWGAASVNIQASDLVLRNLTVLNDYGDLDGDRDHQFAVRLMSGTRIIFDNCRFISGGGDTVSLWDSDSGQYYHRDCYFDGYVDLLCPRGWCYVTHSNFMQRKRTATLWHDGSRGKTQKLVVRNSHFDGVPGFKLGRRHRDGQFILLDCSFAAEMADEAIYRVTYPDDPARDAANLWGDRNFYQNCSRMGGDYSWHGNEPESWQKGVGAEEITATWTFEGRWDPGDQHPPKLVQVNLSPYSVQLHFGENVTVKGVPRLFMVSGNQGVYTAGSGSRVLEFQFTDTLPGDDQLAGIVGQSAWIISSVACLGTNNLVRND